MDVLLKPIARDAADAILAGSLPPGVVVAPGYPTELSSGIAAHVGAPSSIGPFFVHAADGVVVGEIGGGRIEPGTAEIGYAIVDTCTGRGYATAAVIALLALLRDEDDVDRVIAHTPPDRPASSRVLEKAGFTLAGEVEDEHEGVVMRVTRWEHPR